MRSPGRRSDGAARARHQGAHVGGKVGEHVVSLIGRDAITESAEHRVDRSGGIVGAGFVSGVEQFGERGRLRERQRTFRRSAVAASQAMMQVRLHAVDPADLHDRVLEIARPPRRSGPTRGGSRRAGRP